MLNATPRWRSVCPRTRRRRRTTASPERSRSPRPPGPPARTTCGWSRRMWTWRAPRASCRASSAVGAARAAAELPRFVGYETRLRDGLGPVRSRFAYTLLDCPPSLGPVAVNALVAADKVIVPVQAEYLALEGLVQFLDTLKLVRRELNPQLEIAGVLITMHDDRTRLSHDVERELREHLPARVFKTVVPRSVRVAEAPSYGIPVSEHDPRSPGSKAYRALADEVLALGAVDG